MNLSPSEYSRLVTETAQAQEAALEAATNYDEWEAARDRFTTVWRELAAINPNPTKENQ